MDEVPDAFPLTGTRLCFDRAGRRLVAIEANGVATHDVPRSETSRITVVRAKGGAKLFMEREILHKSLTGHGVVLTTDHAKEKW